MAGYGAVGSVSSTGTGPVSGVVAAVAAEWLAVAAVPIPVARALIARIARKVGAVTQEVAEPGIHPLGATLPREPARVEHGRPGKLHDRVARELLAGAAQAEAARRNAVGRVAVAGAVTRQAALAVAREERRATAAVEAAVGDEGRIERELNVRHRGRTIQGGSRTIRRGYAP